MFQIDGTEAVKCQALASAIRRGDVEPVVCGEQRNGLDLGIGLSISIVLVK